MQGRIFLITLGITLLFLAACQSNEPAVLPTAIDLNAIQTSTAEALLQPTATATTLSTGPTLPPTWTFTPSPTMTEIPPTPEPSPTAIVIEVPTRIFYIFNNDSILSLNPNGSGEESIIVNIGPGVPITDLTFSPASNLLAFAAPGSGSAREVYVSNTDGSYVQQVSNLGFGSVSNLTWSPDGQFIAFFAAQFETQPANLYETRWAGNYPDGTDQRLLVGITELRMGDIAYSPDGNQIYFSNNEIYVLDFLQNQIFGPLNETRGFGPDIGLTTNPVTGNLAYLQRQLSENLNARVGRALVTQFDATTQRLVRVFDTSVVAQQMMWSPDGQRLLVSTQNSVNVFNINNVTDSVDVVSGTAFPPQAVFSPSAEQVAYIDSDPENALLQQIYATQLDDIDPVRLTFHAEGSISDLVWANIPQTP